MNTKSRFSATQILLLLILVLFAGYLVTIFWINMNGPQWYNYDLYADSMVARYMVESRSLFPDQWVFGNQFYVVATPVLSALFYSLTGSTTLSLSLASCTMTVLVVLSFAWCLKPYVSKQSILVGLLCLIGGTLFNTNAATSEDGLQVFYTMGSYYACYIIGIFFTLGIWMRLHQNQKVNPLLMCLCFLINLALGMQSLREMLVLILPLGALIVFLILVDFFKRKTEPFRFFTKDRIFALAMFVASAAGYVLIKVLVKTIPIHQYSILQNVRPSLAENALLSVQAFLDYTGIIKMYSQPEIFEIICAVFTFAVVGYAAVSLLASRKISPMFCLVGFCVISIAAVLCAGVIKIYTRPIYYFVWHILVAFSFVYAFEKLSDRIPLRSIVLTCLILIAGINGYYHFHTPMEEQRGHDRFYQDIADTLHEEGITTLFYDEASFFEAPSIAAYSDDRIICAAFFMHPDAQDTSNFLSYISYLCNTQWFYPEDMENSYLMMSGRRLDYLETYTSEAYREALFSHLTLKHHFTHADKDYYLYTFDAHLYHDMMH